MGAKKVENLLKGVAITGAAVGGASVFGDANLAYANELDTAISQGTSGEVVVQVQETAQAQETVVYEAQAVETAPAVEVAVETEVAPAAENEVEEEETPVEEETQNIEMLAAAPVSQADSAEIASTYTDEELSESAAMSLAVEESELASTSEFQSQSLESTTTSLSEAISETSSEYTSTSTAYSEAGYENEALDELENDVNALLQKEEELRNAALENNELLSTNNYYGAKTEENTNVLHDLEIAMIRYKLVLNGDITADYNVVESATLTDSKTKEYQTETLVYKFWGNTYEEHHFCVKYVDTNGNYREEYYDYATCDKDGNTIYHIANTRNEDQTANVSGINILRKTPVYNTAKMKVDYYQRTSFVATNGTIKGVDWYTKNQYKADVTMRETMKNQISSLSNVVTSLTADLSETLVKASESLVTSESVAIERQASLATSESASEMASQYKSESLVVASESASTSASELASVATSTSASETASTAASESASTSTSESASESAVVAATSSTTTNSASESAGTAAIISVATPVFTRVEMTEAVAVEAVEAPVATVTQLAITDEQVPLTVAEEETAEAEENDSVQIDEEETAKGIKAQTVGSWAPWGMALMSVVTAIIGGYKDSAKNRK